MTKRYPQISSSQLNSEEKRLCLNGQTHLASSPPLHCSSLQLKRKPCWERKECMVNLLFQETLNLLLGANVTSQKPVWRKAGDSLAIFILYLPPFSFYVPSCPPLPLLFTSAHPFIILRRTPLTAETPLCTQVLLRPHSSPQTPCVRLPVCQILSEREQERWSDSAWRTGFCHTVLEIIFPLHQPARATYSQLLLL